MKTGRERKLRRKERQDAERRAATVPPADAAGEVIGLRDARMIRRALREGWPMDPETRAHNEKLLAEHEAARLRDGKGL